MNRAVKTIHFEDHGQDFLEWDLDEHGEVVDSRPLQDWVWRGYRVTNHQDIKPGDRVQVMNRKGARYSMGYPCVDVRVHGEQQREVS